MWLDGAGTGRAQRDGTVLELVWACPGPAEAGTGAVLESVIAGACSLAVSPWHRCRNGEACDGLVNALQVR